MKGQFPLDQFKNLDTPFYYYDTRLLQETLDTVKLQLKGQDQFKVHWGSFRHKTHLVHRNHVSCIVFNSCFD